MRELSVSVMVNGKRLKSTSEGEHIERTHNWEDSDKFPSKIKRQLISMPQLQYNITHAEYLGRADDPCITVHPH
jgi:hypothetical protein